MISIHLHPRELLHCYPDYRLPEPKRHSTSHPVLVEGWASVDLKKPHIRLRVDEKISRKNLETAGEKHEFLAHGSVGSEKELPRDVLDLLKDLLLRQLAQRRPELMHTLLGRRRITVEIRSCQSRLKKTSVRPRLLV